LKNIVLVASDLNIEYCLTVLKGIHEFLENLTDIRLIVTQVKSKFDNHGTYVYQYSSTIDMISAQDVDGYIILSTSFGDFLNELVSLIREKNNSPIISIGVDLPFENCYSTKCNTDGIYRQLVSHLIEKHNCKNIGFFSANETKSEEALERFESYKNALKFNHIEYNPDLVLHGNFTRYLTKRIIAEKYTSKEQVPFDAIICANDLTATGCIEGFGNLGISIPEELKVIGFDDSIQSSLSTPTISSVNQQIQEQGKIAIELIYKAINGEPIPSCTEVSLAPIYRQSCGCISTDNHSPVYRNEEGKVVTQNGNYREFIQGYYDKINDSRNIYIIFDFLHSNETLETLARASDSIFNITGFKGIAVSLYDSPIEWHMGDNFHYPQNIRLACINDKPANIRQIHYDDFYNPHENLIPKAMGDASGFFILQPIYNCSKNYGYFLCHYSDQKLEIYSIYMKIINQAIAQAVEFSRSLEKNHLLEIEKESLEQSNLNLAKQSRTDELTKILNRRGLLEYGQQQINLSISMDTTGSVFFADLDGLKKINDTYGHKMGDLAIQLAAQALKSPLRKADIVGRLSGDEFAVIATDMSMQLLEKARSKLDAACEKLREENDLPFTLSISLGGTEYNNDNYYLKDLLINADKNLYEEKKRHHDKLGI